MVCYPTRTAPLGASHADPGPRLAKGRQRQNHARAPSGLRRGAGGRARGRDRHRPAGQCSGLGAGPPAAGAGRARGDTGRAALEATLVVIDTAPHTAVSIATVAAVATALLIPCRPTALDLAAVAATVAPARAAQKPTAFVLNACPARAPEVAEARTALAPYG